MSDLLIIGLGNIGDNYAGTRHNIGFKIIDAIAESISDTGYKSKFSGEYLSCDYMKRRVILLKPGLYMNLSGKVVASCAQFFKISTNRMLVIHDDIDLKFGEIRMKLGGSAGGHNGLKSIDKELSDNQYWRLRFGVGRPANFEKSAVASYVLHKFSKQEEVEIDERLAFIVDEVLSKISTM